MSKRTTWLACGLVAVLPVLGGALLDRLIGTLPLFTLAGTVLGALYLAGTFWISAPFFSRTVRVLAEPGRFALTFDDGPDPRFTPEISRLLAERGHRATFFVLGSHVRAHPHVVQQVVADGHELASHGFDHGLLAFRPARRVRESLHTTEEAVVAATGSPPVSLLRPPHGVRSPWLGRAIARRGYSLCGWTGSIFDTANPGVTAIVERATRHLRPGATLLLHDGDGSGRGGDRRQTVDALPALLEEAERRGLRSVGLSSLVVRDDLDRGGGQLEAGDGEPLVRQEEQAQAHSD